MNITFQMRNIELLFEEILAEVNNSKNVQKILEFNIEANLTCRIYYKGKNTKNVGWRLIQPYSLGLHKTTGNIVLRAVQLRRTASDTPDGQSKDRYTKLPNGWRMFLIGGILDIKSGVGKFKPSKNVKYNVTDKHIKKNIVKVDNKDTVGDNYIRN